MILALKETFLVIAIEPQTPNAQLWKSIIRAGRELKKFNLHT